MGVAGLGGFGHPMGAGKGARMSDPYFFGYGSLVNRATHVYAPAYRARLLGWRRAWVHTDGRGAPFLTAVRDASSAIDGLVALVPGSNWAALDLREEGYVRHPVAVEGEVRAAQVYAVPPQTVVVQEQPAPILLSYLDVVVQGYLREFGQAGAEAFFATTDGWETPLRDDRAAPLYPRAQVLAAEETAFVDAMLRRVGGRVVA